MSDNMDPWDDNEDEEGFSLNFTDQEADSTAREFSVLPSGKYLVRITDAELAQSQSQKHHGKPYAKFELTVIEDAHGGKYLGQKAWWNVMLFEGALYSAGQLMKAWDLNPRTDRFPRLEACIGKTFVMIGSQKQAMTKSPDGGYEKKWEVEEVDGKQVRKASMRYEPSGAAHPNTWKSGQGSSSSITKSSSSSLLPQ